MLLEEATKLLGKGVFSYLAKTPPANKFRDWVHMPEEQRAFKEALDKAYHDFSRDHKKWVNSLFDTYFLEHKAAPLLAKCLTRDGPPNPDELAEFWVDQLKVPEETRNFKIKEAKPVASDFLSYIEKEMRNSTEFQSLFNSRALEKTCEYTKKIYDQLEKNRLQESASVKKLTDSVEVQLEGLYSGEYRSAEKIHHAIEDLSITLQRGLETFRSDDSAIVQFKKEAREALDTGKHEKAELLLNKASDKDQQEALHHQEVAKKRLRAAAATNAEIGMLKTSQLAFVEAAHYYRKAAELVPKDDVENLAVYLNEAGNAYQEAGRYQEAKDCIDRALKIREEALGPQHKDVAESLNNFAEIYYVQGQYNDAELLYSRALSIRQKISEHSDLVAESLNNMAAVSYAQDRYPEAKRYLERAQAICKNEAPDLQLLMALTQNNLAVTYYKESCYVDAEQLLKSAMRTRETILGPEHPDVAQCLHNLATLYLNQGRYNDAEPLYKRALKIRKQVLGPEHLYVAQTLDGYATLLAKMYRIPEYMEKAAQAQEIRNKKGI